MKALSLWQPWASAIALGLKRIETRGWCTAYRGPLAIHAAKRPFGVEDMPGYLDDWQWTEYLSAAERLYGSKGCPFGAIVATAQLVACERTETWKTDPFDDDNLGKPLTFRESFWGNYEPGRFGWVLEGIKALAKPIPYRGAQGLFDVPDEVMQGGHQ